MKNNGIADFIKPTIITAQQYGTKVSVEIDHSDTDIDELFEAFQTICVGLGYHQSAWKNWIVDRADEYRETDNEELKEKLEAWKFEDDDNDIRHRYLKDSEGFESNIDAVEEMRKYAEEEMAKEAERRMDIIGQNGNEGLHYRATDEDEAEFSNDGGFDGNPHFEWDAEPENDNLFKGDEWKLSQKLIEANKRYKDEVKKINTKKKKDKK
jgi:hypothetical protein